jgi:polysaccharide biosynthesis protein PslG
MHCTRRKAVTLIVAATAAGSLLLAPAASAAPRSFYGVISVETPSSAEFNRMGAGRVGTLRESFVWGVVQGGPDAGYDWGLYDSIVGQAAQNGIKVLPTVYSSPRWVAPTPEHPPPKAAFGEFQRFVRAAADRYGHGGVFWTENPGIPAIPITDWQIWNEPNSPSFWAPKPNAKKYVQLLRVARDGIKDADPKARILLAGLFPTPGTSLGVWLRRYLPQIYRAKGRGLFDGVAVHPYNIRPKDTIADLRDVRRIMARFNDERTPVWITEVGWATGGPPYPLTVDPKRQASYLRNTIRLMVRNRKRLKIRTVIWFSLRDSGNGSIWYEHTGLFTRDGSAKPSWPAFTALTGGSP